MDAGYELFFYSDHTFILPDRIENQLKNNFDVSIKIKNKFQFIGKIYQLVGCKYLPDYYKTFAWMSDSDFVDFRDYQSDSKLFENNNKFFRKGLETSQGIKVKVGCKEYKFIHMDGAHFPYYINSEGNDLEKNAVDAVNCARGSLHIVQDYMEMLKQENVYDSSTIIIMADQGFYKDGVLSNPLFMIKPKNTHGDMKVNNAPVSQADFAATIVDQINNGKKNEYGLSVFDIPENMQRGRLFYLYYLDDYIDNKLRLIEYQADDKTNDVENLN